MSNTVTITLTVLPEDVETILNALEEVSEETGAFNTKVETAADAEFMPELEGINW